MAIESHTVDHPDLRTLDAARLASELADSRTALADELGEDALILAYPQGRYNGTVIAAARAAGYASQRTRVSPGESLFAFARALRPPRRGSMR